MTVKKTIVVRGSCVFPSELEVEMVDISMTRRRQLRMRIVLSSLAYDQLVARHISRCIVRILVRKDFACLALGRDGGRFADTEDDRRGCGNG